MKGVSKSENCSRAGKLGASSRWSDHVKEKTKLVRVYESDALYIDSYCRNAGIPFILGFRLLTRFVSRVHGYSAFMAQRRHDNL